MTVVSTSKIRELRKEMHRISKLPIISEVFNCSHKLPPCEKQFLRIPALRSHGSWPGKRWLRERVRLWAAVEAAWRRNLWPSDHRGTKQIEKTDSVLKPQNQIEWLTHSDSSCFNLKSFAVFQIGPEVTDEEIKRRSQELHPGKNTGASRQKRRWCWESAEGFGSCGQSSQVAPGSGTKEEGPGCDWGRKRICGTHC